MSNAKSIIRSMRPWYIAREEAHFTYEDMRARSPSRRTDQQTVWDHAVLAVAEFVRRLDDYDESRAALIHELLSTKLPKDDE